MEKTESIKRLERWMTTQLSFAYKSEDKATRLQVIKEAITRVSECTDLGEAKNAVVEKLQELLAITEEMD
jgi:hypothetical protein